MARSVGWPEWSLEEHFEIYCRGEISFGPFWDQIIRYWKESLERPDKVLFLKYEDIKEDVVGELKKVAEFVGLPFTEEEEKGGVIEEIVKMCSLKTLKDLEVNKSGTLQGEDHKVEATIFFRKGEVGNWVKQSDCRIIYICRNPLDTVISSWHFYLGIARSEGQPEWSLEEHFEIYCQGKISFGPFWDQMVGYWKESLERPHKVLFLKYEDLKEDVVGELKNP